MKYHRLTQQERYQIYALLKEGLSLSTIAKNIGKDKSTISRELQRNTGQKGNLFQNYHLSYPIFLFLFYIIHVGVIYKGIVM